MGAAHSHSWSGPLRFDMISTRHSSEFPGVRFGHAKQKACPCAGPVVSPVCRERCQGRMGGSAQAQPWWGSAVIKVWSVELDCPTFPSFLRFRVPSRCSLWRRMLFLKNPFPSLKMWSQERNPINSVTHKGKCHKVRDTFGLIFPLNFCVKKISKSKGYISNCDTLSFNKSQ